MRALLSVWDKSGLEPFARGLVELGWELCSTGKTQQALAAAGLPVTSVSDLTGFPEILDGRVKTLHPRVHGGLLARRDLAAHREQLAQHGIEPIDLVVSNLYPFVETIAGRPVPFGASAGEVPLPAAVQEAVEQIDIGGPAMTRAAAKNFEYVIVITDPADYAPVLAALRAGGASRPMRARLAQKAFAHTAQYDAYVAHYLAAANGVRFAEALSLPLSKTPLALGYGENPHQQASFYRFGDPRVAGPSLADLRQLNGDALSYNNLLDLDNAYAIVAEFDEPAVAIVKHNNPCGVGTGATIAEAYRKAFLGDPLSAFGGVIAANRPIDLEMARATRGTMYWVMVAPSIAADALEWIRAHKRPPTRVFELPVPPRAPSANVLPGFALQYRPVLGGFLAQEPDYVPDADVLFTAVSKRPPTERELADLRFAWKVVKHVRSNAVVFARDSGIVSVGAGQMSRVDAAVIAAFVARRSLEKRRELGLDVPAEATPERPAAGAVMATDGFFPFPDAVLAGIEAGVTAIVHPGGAKQDEAATAAADEHGVAMVTTGVRHFRH